MFTARLDGSTAGDELKSRMDSLYADFHRMSLVLENSPEIMASITDDMNAQLTELINTINRSLDNAFSNIDTQRAALEVFIDTQRVRLMKESRCWRWRQPSTARWTVFLPLSEAYCCIWHCS